jgi:hypothetical protein
VLHPSCRRTSSKPGLRRGAFLAPLRSFPMAWGIAPFKTPAPLLFCATGPTPPFDRRGFQGPAPTQKSPCDLLCLVSSLFFLSFCEFSPFCASSSRLNTAVSISLTRALLLASPSLVGLHALTHVCLIRSASLPNHRRSSCKPKTIDCSSRIAPCFRLGRHETICPGHFPCHYTHGSSSRGVFGIKHVHHHELAFFGYSSRLSGQRVISICTLYLTFRPTSPSLSLSTPPFCCPHPTATCTTPILHFVRAPTHTLTRIPSLTRDSDCTSLHVVRTPLSPKIHCSLHTHESWSQLCRYFRFF